MEGWLIAVISAVGAVIASSGFWAFLQHHFEKKSLTNKMLIGLAHDKIIEQGMKYVERGSISHDELENLVDYLFKPYKAMGGNGAAERVVNLVLSLPVTSAPPPTWPEVERRKKCTFNNERKGEDH